MQFLIYPTLIISGETSFYGISYFKRRLLQGGKCKIFLQQAGSQQSNLDHKW